ncbi:MAG: radical SAM protein [Bacteroidales bacterium]|nr:radical SAM protein [Bacteroidales bacterium]
MFPIQYNQPLFRPPSEARSLILQLTLGCSWNSCAFCEMYTAKRFKVRRSEDVAREIDQSQRVDPMIRKVFLADGNAFVLSADKLMDVLEKLNASFPRLMRVSAYALPKDILSKSDNELKKLVAHGLKLLYVGIESGDDELLGRVNKGETFFSTAEALVKARNAGIKLSVMVLNGLGGKNFSEQHAINSALLVNKIQPEYLSTLVLSFPFGEAHFTKQFNGNFQVLSTIELIAEMGIFIQYLDLEKTIFRSDHASNYLILKGLLNRDKEALLEKIKRVLDKPAHAALRPEWLRGL